MGREFTERPEAFSKQRSCVIRLFTFEMQQGLVPSSSHRPMPSIESGVYELREQDFRAWYRVLYFSRIKGKIVVLHCFEKDTRKTERNDIETATRRLKEVLIALRETK
jgi:phage-related protein